MLSKANDAIDLVKKGLDAHIALANAEQKEMLADAKLALADVKILVADLQEENYKLKDRSQLVIEEGHQWLIDPDHPKAKFCPVCMNRDNFKNPLQIHDAKELRCMTCRIYWE